MGAKFVEEENVMRKVAFLFVFLLIVGLVGCNSATPSPTAAPTATEAPAATTAPEAPVEEDEPSADPAGPATCTLAPFEFPPLEGIPPISEEDHVHGPDDAPIVIIEYADFQ
jgi:hypothetical protein